MLEISAKNVVLQQTAATKSEAMTLIAKGLIQLGCVEAGYADAMWTRETQTFTYLGNGLAIPHGTLESRKLVKQTGVFIAQFPEGIDWGEGNMTYVAVGIAAKSDEHLLLLKRLTHLLSDDKKAKRLANTTDLKDFIQLFNDAPAVISKKLFSLKMKTDNLLVLTAENVRKLQNNGYCDYQFLSNRQSHQPLPLGHDCYLTDSPKGNLKNGVALSRTKDGTVMLTVSLNDNQLEDFLGRLTKDDFLIPLKTLEEKALEQHLNQWIEGEVSVSHGVEGVFQIKNPQGLHARPASVLAKLVKSLDCDVKVKNKDTHSNFVNAKNLMKLLTLGTKKGHHLHFVVTGNNAEKALAQIEAAIAEGLGEQCDS